MRFARNFLGATVVGLASLLSSPGCGGGGTRTIQAPVDEDPGQTPPTPQPDPFPDAIPYAPLEELVSNDPYPGQIMGTGGFISQDYTVGGQIIYDLSGQNAQLRAGSFYSPNPQLNVGVLGLASQPQAVEYLQTRLDEGKPVTFIGVLRTEANNRWFDVYGVEDGVDPLDPAHPNYEDTIGNNLQPMGNPYVRPNTP